MANAIGQKAISGTFWMVTSFGLSKVTTLVTTIILARLLFPEDFGVFAMAGAAVGMISALGDMGIGLAVIYKQEPNQEYMNSAFWLAIAIRMVQSAVIVAGAEWASQLYGNESIGDILKVLGVLPIAVALGEVHQMAITRDLRFKAKAVLELLPGLCSAFVSVSLALLGLGVWSMVFGLIVGTFLSNAVAWSLLPWRPSLHISVPHVREVISYAKSLFGLSFLAFLAENIDYIIIGRFLGAAPLGLYSQAYRLATYPETAIVWPVEKVAFPTFARLRDDRDALHAAFLKTIQYMALVAFPLLTLLTVLSRQLVLTLFGDKWEGMILPLQILCVVGISRAVTAVSKQMLYAVGRPDIALKCNLVVLPIVAVGVLVGTQFGIVGVSVVMTVFPSIGVWALLVLTSRHIELPLRKVVSAIQPGASVALAMFAGLIVYQMLVAGAFSTVGFLNLAYSILIGFCLFLLGLTLFSRQVFSEVLAAVVSLKRKREDEARATVAG